MAFFKAPDGRMYASRKAYQKFCRMIAEETFERDSHPFEGNRPQPKATKPKDTPTLKRVGVRVADRITGEVITGVYKTGEAAKVAAHEAGFDLTRAMLVSVYGSNHKPTWVKRAGVCARSLWLTA